VLYCCATVPLIMSCAVFCCDVLCAVSCVVLAVVLSQCCVMLFCGSNNCIRCIVLCSIELCPCSVVFCEVLCCATWPCDAVYCAVQGFPCCAVLCCVVLSYTFHYCCCVVLCSVVLNCALLFWIQLNSWTMMKDPRAGPTEGGCFEKWLVFTECQVPCYAFLPYPGCKPCCSPALQTFLFEMQNGRTSTPPAGGGV